MPEQLGVTDFRGPMELVRLLDFGFGLEVEQLEEVEPQLLEDWLAAVRQGHFLLEQLEGLPAQHFLLVGQVETLRQLARVERVEVSLVGT